MGNFDRVNVSLPKGWRTKARSQGISLSGALRCELSKRLDLSEEEIQQYRKDLGLK